MVAGALPDGHQFGAFCAMCPALTYPGIPTEGTSQVRTVETGRYGFDGLGDRLHSLVPPALAVNILGHAILA
jgi:hypothetical protein